MREQQERADEIWNRACDAMMTGLPPDAKSGDVKLMRAIDFDGLVHNGGLLNRVQREDGLVEAVEALRWFGLTDVAERVERVRDAWGRLADQGWPGEAVDELEIEADRLYFEMPQGQVADQLEAGLLTRLVDAPGAFSPL